MKTPEEIKKGLGRCQLNKELLFVDCSHCPYYMDTAHCDLVLHADALAYIQKLEERNKTLEYTLLGVMHSIDKWLDVEPYDFDKDDGTEAATRASNAREVALKAIEQLRSSRWELFDDLSTAYYGKVMYGLNDDGTVYSRYSCDTMSFEQAVREFRRLIADE